MRYIFFLFSFIFLIGIVSSLGVDIPTGLISGNGSQINVNNSQFLQSLTPQQVADLFDDSGLIPYTGATSNVDLGTYDLTAGTGRFDGGLTDSS